jgi:hypothetical protein
VNFTIRPNKAVERRLIFDYLIEMAELLSLRDARYLGLGSIWFVDFVFAHKVLSITDLISIEEEERYTAIRAEYNKPYACIKVLPGETAVILPDMNLEEKKILAWLDYDASLEGSALDDLAVLSARAPANSIILATVNAHRGTLPSRDAAGNEYPGYDARLRAVAGDLVPDPLPHTALQTSGYPKLVAQLLFERAKRSARLSGRDERAIPLFSIRYKDDAPMVTVGIAVVGEETGKKLAQLAPRMPLPGFLDTEVQIEIDVPPLTYKEKVALDQLMPIEKQPSEEELFDLVGFKLKPSQIRSYASNYKHYPTLGDLTV